MDHRPEWRIGTAKRDNSKDITNSPGPGAYEYKSRAVEGPKYHLGLKTLDASGKVVSPGPASYGSNKKSMFSNVAYSFASKSGQGFWKNNNTPGPA